ncbi:glycerol-3-phosphate acyltransferase [Bittarella massiliensis (ex Durand et al. 2017)]|uniref:glycerol-3-phosphate acyltransferase n=1 Tax=Bittarella massiliensis (ex Durand et al. 2017) TaxID=1720313 RepID=UPI001AA11C20|nr:glycerol-3-phosphate acyltransferase [Bittarella massiliensis (ex Durand et al. 2017)]
MLPYLFYALLGFLSGSILYSALLPRWLRGVDVIADSDDHNPGATNAFLLAGVQVGTLCVLCDLAKGFFPVFLAAERLPTQERLLFSLVLAAPVLGHAFSPWRRGRGGKAITASFGALLGLLPGSLVVFWLAALYLFFSLIAVIPDHRLRTLATFSLFAGGSFLLCPNKCIAAGCTLISAAVIFRHLKWESHLSPEVLKKAFERRIFS